MTDKPIISGNGVKGSNTYRVFAQLFDHNDYEYRNAGTFPALFDGLIDGRSEKIIVPTHNAAIGEVSEVAKVMADIKSKGVELVQEGKDIPLRLYHALIGGPAASLETVRTAISYNAALDQCAQTMQSYGLKMQDHADTYGAAVDVVAKNDPSEAAIAPIEAAADLGGVVLVEDMSDIVPNITFFKVFTLK